jgi:hypothetical protein
MRRIRFDKMISKNTAPLLLLICLLSRSPAPAQSGGDYILEWSTVDGGAGRSTGGSWVQNNGISLKG